MISAIFQFSDESSSKDFIFLSQSISLNLFAIGPRQPCLLSYDSMPP